MSVGAEGKVRVSRKGVAIRKQAREFVCSVRSYFVREEYNRGPLLPVERVLDRTADALSIHKNTVIKICKEKCRAALESGPSASLSTPGKKRKGNKRVTSLDSYREEAIRRHIYAYYLRKEYPIIKKLLISLRKEDIFTGSSFSLREVVKNIGFQWKVFNKRKVLMERSDVVAQRCSFLRSIREVKFGDIVWVDETCINTGLSLIKGPGGGGDGHEVAASSAAGKPGKGGGVVVCHAGTSSGFVPDCLLLLRSRKTSDCRDEMDTDTFHKWFRDRLLPNLRAPSVIVLDAALCHSAVCNKPPGAGTKKSDVIKWLRQQDVRMPDQYRDTELEELYEAELLELVNLCKTPFPKYVVDEMAAVGGHRVLRLPCSHGRFNAIELIWPQVKVYVAERNKTFTFAEVEELLVQGFRQVTADNWSKAVDHTMSVIEDAWKEEGLLEEAVEKMLLSLGSSSSSSSDMETEPDTEDEEVWSRQLEMDSE